MCPGHEFLTKECDTEKLNAVDGRLRKLERIERMV